MTGLIAKIKEKPGLLGFLSLPIFFFALLFLDYSFRWIYSFAGGTRVLALKPMAFTCGWALLLTSLLSLLPPRLPRRIGMLVLGVFLAFLALLHAVMFNIFGHFFSFADMNFAGDGARFFSWTYFNVPKRLVLCLLVFLALTGLAAFLPHMKLTGKMTLRLRLGALALAVISLAPIYAAASKLAPREDTMTWGSTYNPTDERELYRDFTDANRCLKLTGLYQYTFRNLAVSMGWVADFQTLDELDDFFQERALEISTGGELTGAMEGKNLIMVMLESIDTWLAQPEYMPNLCRLQQEGVDLTNFHTPLFLSSGTFNTEFITQAGMLPPVSGFSSAGYSTNAFPNSLASLFASEGYTVNSFHSANPGIYSRGSIHTNLGFEAYHNYKDMGMDDYQLDSQMMRGYDQMVTGDRFYTFIISYSGHGPYTEELGNISATHWDEAVKAVANSGVTGSEKNMSEYTHAVAHAMETDQFIGELTDRLAADGLLDDTVLVFYGDHYGKYMTDKDFLAEVKGVGSSGQELYRTPCIFYGGGLEARKVDKVTWSGDLVPTLVSMYNLPVSRRYYVGEDIFSDSKGVALFPNGGWYDGETFYEGGESDDDDFTARARRRVMASMDAVKSDYFKNRDMVGAEEDG